MSELRDIIASSVLERAAYTNELARDLKTGATFSVEYQEITPLSLLTALGDDPRESGYLYLTDKQVAGSIQGQGLVQVQLYGQWHTFTILSRENNPGSSQVCFKVKYQVPGKDQ